MLCFLEGIACSCPPALHFRPFFARLLEVCVCVYVCVCISALTIQVSEISKASLGQSPKVRSSGLLNSVGLSFEREGRCSTFHFQTRGVPALFSYSPFFIFSLKLPAAPIILSPVSTFFVFCMLLKTALSHSHVRGLCEKKEGDGIQM